MYTVCSPFATAQPAVDGGTTNPNAGEHCQRNCQADVRVSEGMQAFHETLRPSASAI